MPVDYASRAIVQLSRQSAVIGQNFHITAHSFSGHFLYDFLRGAGYPVEPIPEAEWRELFTGRVKADQTAGSFAMLPGFVAMKTIELAQRFNFHCSNTLTGLAGTGIICPPTNDSLFQKYLAYLIKQGCLPAPSSQS